MTEIADMLMTLASLLASTARVATPLVLAAFAGLLAERAGIADIGLEGKMLAAAFLGAAVAWWTGSPWPGLAAAIAVSVALSMVHGFAAITCAGDQVVSGMAINITVAGLTPTLAHAWFQLGGQTPGLPPEARIPTLPIGGVAENTSVLVLVALLVVVLGDRMLWRTRFGLRLRAVGESPDAVETAGISVVGLRYRALMLNGVLCGLAGAYLSIAHGAGFLRDMTAGKGYLALAALIFGKWRPWPTLVACLLFAFADAAQARLQGVELPLIGVVPVQFIQMAPYVLTVALLAGVVGRAVAPKALGVPFLKERR